MIAYINLALTNPSTRPKGWAWPQNASKWKPIRVRKWGEVGPLLQRQPITSSNSRTMCEFHQFCCQMRIIWSIWGTSIRRNSLHRQILRRHRSHTASKSRPKGTELQDKHPSYQEIQDQQLIHSLKTRCFNQVKHQSANRGIVSEMQIYSPRLEVQTNNSSALIKDHQLIQRVIQGTPPSINHPSISNSIISAICPPLNLTNLAWNTLKAQLCPNNRPGLGQMPAIYKTRVSIGNKWKSRQIRGSSIARADPVPHPKIIKLSMCLRPTGETLRKLILNQDSSSIWWTK